MTRGVDRLTISVQRLPSGVVWLLLCQALDYTEPSLLPFGHLGLMPYSALKVACADILA